MKRVAKKRVGRKSEIEGVVDSAISDLDACVEAIQALISVALDRLAEDLQKSVEALAGRRYQRGTEDRQFYRWGSQLDSVYLGD